MVIPRKSKPVTKEKEMKKKKKKKKEKGKMPLYTLQRNPQNVRHSLPIFLPPSFSSQQKMPGKNACIIIRIFSLLMSHMRGKRCSTRLVLLLWLDRA
jgi:hypothetical protein